MVFFFSILQQSKLHMLSIFQFKNRKFQVLKIHRNTVSYKFSGLVQHDSTVSQQTARDKEWFVDGETGVKTHQYTLT